MDRDQALYAFWAGFELPAYDEGTVPESAGFPRITYNVSLSSFNQPVIMTASIWDRTRSWENVSKKAQEISEKIGMGGVMVPFQGGAIWIKMGTPFAQRVTDEDDMIRRILLNIEAEFISAS